MNTQLLNSLAAAGLLITVVAALGAKNLRHFSHRRLEVLSRAWRRRELFDEIIDLHETRHHAGGPISAQIIDIFYKLTGATAVAHIAMY